MATGSPAISEEVLRVHTGNDSLLGVCFPIPVLDAKRAGTFFLTAGHCAWRPSRTGEPIFLVLSSGERIIGTEILVTSVPNDSCDLALLYSESARLAPFRCLGGPRLPSVALVRGAPEAGLGQFTNLEAHIAGLERQDDELVLDIVLPDYGPIEAKQQTLPGLQPEGEYVWPLRGLSGGPVIVGGSADRDTAEPSGVVGIVVRRNRNGLANRVLAIPMDQVAHQLEDWGYALALEQPHPTIHEPMLILVAENFNAAIDDATREWSLWELISGLSYQGQAVISILMEMLRRPETFGLRDRPALYIVEHFASRLLSKAGRDEEAITIRSRLLRSTSSSPEPVSQRIHAVAGLREAAEAVRDTRRLQNQIESLKRSIGAVESLSLPDEYFAYEVASATGRLAMEAFRNENPEQVLSVAGNQLYRLAGDHYSLLEENRAILAEKQEIVQLGLRAMLVGTEMAFGGEDPESLLAIVREGMTAARQRDNVIFMCQMLLLYSIAQSRLGGGENFLVPAMVAAAVLKQANIRAENEGVAQVLSLMEAAVPEVARLSRAVRIGGLEYALTVSRLRKGALPVEEAGQRAALLLREIHEPGGLFIVARDVLA